jgi:uncharacterized protein
MSTTFGRLDARCAAAAVLFAVLVLGSTACQTAAPSPPATMRVFPKPDRVVTDVAGILSAEEIAALEADILDVRRRGLAEMVVYIAPSLPAGEVLEDFTLRTANAWSVGRADADDGLVIFIFMAERAVRIELGVGLESAISNEAAARVIAEKIAPPFQRAAYAEGLHGAVEELARLLVLKKDEVRR